MKHTTTPTPASLEALHALSNRIVPVRWQLAGLLRVVNKAAKAAEGAK